MDQQTRLSDEYSHLMPLLLWTAVWLIFFAPLLLGEARLPTGDLAGQFHAFGLFQARQLAEGQLPLWSPGSYAGFPFLADTQSAAFYPLRWLTLLVSLPFGFSFYLLTLEGLLHIWLAGLFTYLLAFDITQRSEAALLAAIAFGLGGYLTSYPLLQLAILETVTWLPLVLLLLRRGINGRSAVPTKRPLPWLLAAGLVLGMAALVGHLQTFMHLSYLAAAYYLFLTAQNRWAWRWRLGLGAIIAVTAVGTAMIGLLPAWRYLQLTTRSEVGYAFVSQGFPLLNYLHLLLPRTLSLWTPEYVGLLTLGLALTAVLGRRHTPFSTEIGFWSGTAVVAAWLSLGDKGILFELVHRIVPGFALFRQQERLVAIVSLSIALLAAQGLALWMATPVGQRPAWLKRPFYWLAGGLLLGGLMLAVIQPSGQANWLTTWGRQLAIATLVALLLWWGYSRLRVWVLIALLAVDLFIPIRAAMQLADQPPSVFWSQPEWVAHIQADEPGRIDSRLLFTANVGEIYELEDIRGISPLKLQWLADFETLPRPTRWQLLNVTHVLAEAPVEPSLTAVEPIHHSIMPGELVDATLYEFADALPRAWISYDPLLVPDSSAALERLRDPDFDPATQVVVTDPALVETVTALPPTTPPTLTLRRPAPNRWTISAQTAVPGVLVLSEWAIPGWRVQVNETAVSPRRVNYALIGIPLSAGQQTITLNYRPPGVVTGSGVTLLTLLFAVLLAWLWRPRVEIKTAVVPAKPAVSPFPPRPWSTFQTDWLAWSQRHWRWLLFAILFAGFGLRLAALGTQELRGDEAFSYLFARQPIGDIIPALLAEGDPHSPLHYLLLHGWMRLAGDSELAMRFLSLIPGVLLLPLLAQLARQIGGRSLALWVTLMLALSPSHIWLSQDVRNQYTLGLLFATAATLLLSRLARTSRPQWGQWVVYAGLCALAVYSHYYTAVALLGHGLFLLATPGPRQQVWRWVGAGGLALLLFAPWAIAMVHGLLAAGQLSDPAFPELANHLTIIGRELLVGSTLTAGWTRWLFLVALLLVMAGARQLWRQQPGWAGLLLTWLVGTTLLIYLVRFNRATFNPFYGALGAPAWWLLIGMGLQWLWQRKRPTGVTTAVLLTTLFVAVSSASLLNHYTNPAGGRSLGYRPMAAHVQENWQPGDLFLAHFPDPAFVYYLRHIPVEYAMQPSRYQPPAAETAVELTDLAAKHDRIWFVPAPGSAWDAENVVPTWLEANLLQTEATPHQRLDLLVYQPLRVSAQVTQAINRPIGPSILLREALITVDGVRVGGERPFALPPGAQLSVTLLWQATQPVDQHYTAFVHLLNENGQLVAQDDAVPAQGRRPTNEWPLNTLILDKHTLTVPPDRAFNSGQLRVGLYQTATVERLPFANGDDAATIATIQNSP